MLINFKKYYNPSQTRDFKIISFDLFNDGLYFPGEKFLLISKTKFFASEVINALLVPLRHNGGVGGQQKLMRKTLMIINWI